MIVKAELCYISGFPEISGGEKKKKKGNLCLKAYLQYSLEHWMEVCFVVVVSDVLKLHQQKYIKVLTLAAAPQQQNTSSIQ